MVFVVGPGGLTERVRPPEVRAPVVRGRWVARATWAYAGVVLAALALIRWRGDDWWPATLLLFLPRWPFLLPIPFLALAAGWRGRRGLWGTQAAIALIVLGPLMAGSLPIARPRGVTGPRLRIMTFNRASRPIDAKGLIDLVEREGIDLICFQEEGHAEPELEAYFARGWSKDHRGTILSRLPIVGEWDYYQRHLGLDRLYNRRVARVRVRAEDGAEFVVACVHLPTVREGFEALMGADVDGLRAIENWRREQVEATAIELDEVSRWPVLVGGDLNTPPDSPILSPLRSRFELAFERAGWGYGYTKPTRLPWTRIDHILAGPQWAVTRCWVGPDLGSDHLPLIAEVALRR